MRRTLLVIAWTMLVWSLPVAAAQAEYRTADRLTVSEAVTEDLYVTAESIEVRAAIDGDLVAAGRTIAILAPVSQDVIVAGQTVRLESTVQDDVRAAAQRLLLADRVLGHVVAAGAEVRLGSAGEVTDWAWLAGREIRVEGRIGGGARLAGQTVTVSGTVVGDTHIRAEHLRITPSARIEGNLVVRSPNEPDIANEAVITGEVSVHAAERFRQPGWMQVLGPVYGTLVLMVTAVVGYLLLPTFSVNAAHRMRRSPWQSLGLGVLLAIGLPLAIVVLLVSGIGALLGLGLFAAFVVWLLLGFIVAMVFLAAVGIRWVRRGEQAHPALWAFAVALAVIVLVAVRTVPLLGSLLTLLLILFSLGSVSGQLWSNRREARRKA